MRPFRSSVFSFATVAATAMLAGADVLVVAPSGGQYAQIQAAVVAAAAGDVVLVRSGVYAPVTVDGKSLTIQADAGATVTVQGTTIVRNLPAEGVVVLSGFRGNGQTTTSTDPTAGVGLLLASNAGFVRVQECEFHGAVGAGDGTDWGGQVECCDLPPTAEGRDAARVESSSGGVTFTRTLLRGGRGASGYYTCWCGGAEEGGDALLVSASMAALHDCDLLAGDGGANGSWGGPGGTGLVTSVALGVLASNTRIQGGRGGDGLDWAHSGAGTGGDGALIGLGTTLQTIGCTLLGNAGGMNWSTYQQGPSGNPIGAFGDVFAYAVPPVEMVAPVLVREATTWTIVVRGVPGSTAAVRVGRRPEFVPIPSWRGVSLVRGPAAPSAERVMLLGTIPAGGEIQASFDVPALPAGIASAAWYLQALILDPATGRTLGTGQVSTVLDSSY